MRVLPDVAAIDKEFDYTAPADASVAVGDVVRIELHGRRVGGWITAVGVEAPPGLSLRPLAKVSGRGPAPELFDLADWAAWRWAGRRATFLNTASPDRVVGSFPPPPRSGPPVPAVTSPLITEAFTAGQAVVRLPPAADPYDVALAAAARGDALVLTPSLDGARRLAVRLRRAGVTVSVPPRDWAQAAAGGTVVGARAAAWAPVADLAAVVVLDEHDESYQEERAPTWHARDVAIERARRAGVPCVLVSPAPTLEAQAWGRLLTPSRRAERDDWPMVDVIDRRRDEAPLASSLYTSRLVDRLRSGGRAVCVLNRTGRSRLLACAACGELARCEVCDAAVGQADPDTLVCGRCGAERPTICLHCNRTKLKNLRVGVSRAREELEALVREPVGEVTASTSPGETPSTRVLVGTEAVLHHVDTADTVAFLDLDQELLAPRYRTAEQAFALVARGARVVGGREGGGRLILQTRLPRHAVVQAALLADPARVADEERERRRTLGFPPVTVMAVVSGAAAPAFMEAFGTPLGVEVLGPRDDQWLLKAPDHGVLCDALAATPRPSGRLRVEVDPLRT